MSERLDLALAALDEALSALPDQPGYRTMRAGALLRASETRGLEAVAELDDRGARAALAYRARDGRPPSPALVEVVGERLAACEASWKTVSLARWAGLDAPSWEPLDPTSRVRAIEAAIRMRAPAEVGASLALIDAALDGFRADRARTALVRERSGKDPAGLVDACQAIERADLRLHALFELSVPHAAPPRDLYAHGQAAWEEVTARDQLLPGLADAQLAALGGPHAAIEAAAALSRARAVLEDSALTIESRCRLWGPVIVAATQLDVARWRDLVERFKADRALLRAVDQRVELVYVIADSVGYLRLGDAPAAADPAINAARELIRKAPEPATQAAAYARLAELSARIPGRSAAAWTTAIRQALRLPGNPEKRRTGLPKVARMLGSVDYDDAAAIGGTLRDPVERALWWTVMLELAA